MRGINGLSNYLVVEKIATSLRSSWEHRDSDESEVAVEVVPSRRWKSGIAEAIGEAGLKVIRARELGNLPTGEQQEKTSLFSE
jgi:hypothetical protein